MTLLQYIHTQIAPLTTDLSTKMSTKLHFQNIAAIEHLPNVPSCTKITSKQHTCSFGLGLSSALCHTLRTLNPDRCRPDTASICKIPSSGLTVFSLTWVRNCPCPRNCPCQARAAQWVFLGHAVPSWMGPAIRSSLRSVLIN